MRVAIGMCVLVASLFFAGGHFGDRPFTERAAATSDGLLSADHHWPGFDDDADHVDEEPSGGVTTDDVLEPALWTILGVAVFAVVFGVFFLFKRGVGGFPKNPSWTAPISIERSSTLPDDESDEAKASH